VTRKKTLMLTLAIAAAGVLVYGIAQPDPADYRVDESLVVYRAEVPSVQLPRIENISRGIGRWVVQGLPDDDITLATYDNHRVPEELSIARRDGVDTDDLWRDMFKPNFVWHVSRENATVIFTGADGWDPDAPVQEIMELSDRNVKTRMRLQERVSDKTKPSWWPRLERGGEDLPVYGIVVPMHEAMWYVLVGGVNRSSTDMFGKLTSYKGPLRLVIRDITDMSVTRLAVIELPSDTPNVGMNVSFSKDAQWAIASDPYHHIWIIPLAEMWGAFEAAAQGDDE
jgi:hypothetical protein